MNALFTDSGAVVSEDAAAPRTRMWRTFRDSAGAVVGAVLGIAPHVLHHIGLLAGAALVTGASGNALFYAIGLLFSVPMLRRIHRHFHSWWAPAIAVAVFTGLFSLSAFVIGPAISGSDQATPPPAPTSQTPSPSDGLDEHGH
jgi:hypothetical protein